MRFIEIIKRFKLPLFTVWSLIVLEKILWVIEPSFFGRVIDAVINHGRLVEWKTEKYFLIPLIVWSAVFISNTVIGLIRRIQSQKIFLSVLASATEENLKKSLDQNLDDSVLISRTQNTRDFVTFLQVRCPEVIDVTVAIIGSLIALIGYDKRIGLICVLMIIPLYFLDRISSPKILQSQKEFRDKNQALYSVVASRNLSQIRSHFLSLIPPQLNSTRWAAYNFGILRVSLFCIFLIILIISFDVDHFSTGTIYAIVSYLWTYITAIESLPEIRETISSLQDLDQRLANGSVESSELSQ